MLVSPWAEFLSTSKLKLSLLLNQGHLTWLDTNWLINENHLNVTKHSYRITSGSGKYANRLCCWVNHLNNDGVHCVHKEKCCRGEESRVPPELYHWRKWKLTVKMVLWLRELTSCSYLYRNSSSSSSSGNNNKTNINCDMNCLLTSLKRHFSQRLERSSSLSQLGYYFLHTKLSGKIKAKWKYQLKPNFLSYYTFALYALLSACTQ